MNSSGNTILITGGGSGIGRAFAEAFHAAGNQVIIAGRRREARDAVAASNPGMTARVLDVGDLDDAEATIAANLLGPIRLTAALLPHLRRQPAAAVVNVTSGLAFVPRADTPTYSATKAALHSCTESLRHLLRDTPVQVIELAPPLVATDLTPGQRANPRTMPLDDYVRESMALLRANPDAPAVYVERVKFQRFAEAEGRYDAAFRTINPA